MVKNKPANTRDIRDILILGPGRFPWRRTRQPTPVFLLGGSHGQSSLVGYSPQHHKESERLKQLSMHLRWLSGKESACNSGDMGSIPGLGEPLLKEMATASSIFVWEISWTRGVWRGQSRGSQELSTCRLNHHQCSFCSSFPPYNLRLVRQAFT